MVCAKKILIIGVGDAGIVPLADAIYQRGYEPVFICDLKEYYGDIRKMLMSYNFIDTKMDYNEVDRVVKTLVSETKGIISTRDNGIELACQMAKRYSLQGLDPAVIQINNKCNLVQLLPDYSPESIVFEPFNIPIEAIQELQKKHNQIVIKPSKGTDGIGVSKVSSREELLNSLKEIKKVQHKEWLAQELVSGQGALLEGYVLNGVITFLGFGMYYSEGRTDTMFIFPADKFIAPTNRKQAYEAVTKIIERSNYKNGYFHTEFIINKDFAYVVDPNFGRIGGSGYALQLPITFQISSDSLQGHILDVSLFHFEQSKELFKKNPITSLSVNYGLKHGGAVFDVLVPNDTKCYHLLELNLGTYVKPIGIGNESWVGISIGKYDDVLDEIGKIYIKSNLGLEKAYCSSMKLEEIFFNNIK